MEDFDLTKQGFTSMLQKGIMTIHFTKNDGSERKMVCTLDGILLNEEEMPEPSKSERRKKTPNAETVSAWDLEKKAWRSFNVHSVYEYSFEPTPVPVGEYYDAASTQE